VSLLEVFQSAQAADEIQKQTTLAETSIGPWRHHHRAPERAELRSGVAAGIRDRGPAPGQLVRGATAATDASVAAFGEEINRLGGKIKETYGPALDEINTNLATLRNYVTSFTGERGQNNTSVSEPFYLAT
jgi:hypothetical protein